MQDLMATLILQMRDAPNLQAAELVRFKMDSLLELNRDTIIAEKIKGQQHISFKILPIDISDIMGCDGDCEDD